MRYQKMQQSMKIHKEGNKILIYTFIPLLILNWALFRATGHSLLSYFVLSLSIGIFLLILNFFRFPARRLNNKQQGTVVAPADGTVVVIEEVMENDFFHE